jgi:hypothetical protein
MHGRIPGVEHAECQISRRQDRRSQAVIARLVRAVEGRPLLGPWIYRGTGSHNQMFRPNDSDKSGTMPSPVWLVLDSYSVHRTASIKGMPNSRVFI